MMEGGSGWSGGGGGNNWDLNAVVRFGCGGGRVASPPPLSGDDTFSAFLPPPLADGELHGVSGQPLPDLPPGYDGDLYGVFFWPSPPLPLPLPPQPQQQQAAAVAPPGNPLLTTGLQLQADSSCGARFSKRKIKEVKTVVKRLEADKKSSESDPWAWRKYGQKPIKGSPHPRSYYRCSTDKACQARKHVERCLAEPDAFFVLTFTGEHNHPAPLIRNSLAGTTRNKQPPPPKVASNGTQKAPVATAAAAATAAAKEAGASPRKSMSAGLSPTTPVQHSHSGEYGQEEEEDNEEMEVNDTGVQPDVAEMAREEDVPMFLNPDQTATEIAGGYSTTAPIMNVAGEDGPLFLNPNQSAMEVVGGDSTLYATFGPAPVMNISEEDQLLFWNPNMPAMGLGVGGDYTVYGGAGMAPMVNVADEDALLLMTPSEHEAAMEVGGDYRVGGGAGPAPILNVVEDTFVVTPWITAAGDAILAGAGDAVFAAEGGWH